MYVGILTLPTFNTKHSPSAVGLSVDCSEWVKLRLIDESDKLDRNWAYWTTFSQVSMYLKEGTGWLSNSLFLGRMLVALRREGFLRVSTGGSRLFAYIIRALGG